MPYRKEIVSLTRVSNHRIIFEDEENAPRVIAVTTGSPLDPSIERHWADKIVEALNALEESS